jgi:Predicted esterase
MFRALEAVVFLVVVACVHWPEARAQTAAPPFPLGAVIPDVTVVQNSQQTYALYLPKRYSPNSRWPVVYVFDPLARGELALGQFEHAAERNGFIVAASNNSRNGPWAPQIEAAEAMVSDTRQRFSIDTRRIYFAGFSGGARVSSQLALRCKCAAGVLLSGAGFPHSAPPSTDVKFAVFSAVGNADFNYSEMVPLQEQLEEVTLPHWLRVFDGPHEWAPPEVMNEALAWLRLQAIRAGLAARDDELTAAQLKAARERAALFELSGDLLSAWREYRQIAATFDSLADIGSDRSKSAALERDKAVRDGQKHERSAFAEQDRLSDGVLAAVLATSANSADAASRPAQSAQQSAHDLRRRSLNEKKPDRALIFKRALGGVSIGSIEAGNAAVEKKDYWLAARYFACAAEANPESEWVFRRLAVARALSGDRAGTIESLRAARKLTKNFESFSEWCEQENAFAELRGKPDFKAIAE